MASRLRVGMIGAGSMARHHLVAWCRHDDCQVAAIYNRTRHKAEVLAKEFGIPRVYDHVNDLIDRDDLDAVSISMPHAMHHPLSVAAIESGKHVFCEKPLATNLRDAKEMWERARKAGVKTGIQFGHRFSPALNRLRELLRDGYLGQVQRVECSWCFDWARDPSFPLVWRFKRNIAGAGALADLGVYAIDAARWLIGEFSQVSGSVKTYVKERPILLGRLHFAEVVEMAAEGALLDSKGMGRVENEDDCSFLAILENDVHGVFWASRMHSEQRLAVYGSEGVLVWYLSGDKLLGKRGTQGLADVPVPRAERPPTIVGRFVSAIKQDTDLSPNFADGVKAQEIIEAVLRSAEQGRWMSIPGAGPTESQLVCHQGHPQGELEAEGAAGSFRVQ